MMTRDSIAEKLYVALVKRDLTRIVTHGLRGNNVEREVDQTLEGNAELAYRAADALLAAREGAPASRGAVRR